MKCKGKENKEMVYHNGKQYLNEMLFHYEFLMEQQERELKQLPCGSLYICDSGRGDGTSYYYHHCNGRRKGITKNLTLVQALARKKYLETSISMIRKNIAAIKRTINSVEDIDQQQILKRLRPEYSDLIYAPLAAWNEEKRRWLSEDFEQSTFRPWEKEQTTANGLWVRTKSEVIVAERLDYYGIPYRYEQMLYIENREFAPDFTIFTRKGLFYWEHAGMINERQYIDNHIWKLSMYRKANIVPWKNLIVTYDREDGGIDSRIIEAEIHNKLLPYC